MKTTRQFQCDWCQHRWWDSNVVPGEFEQISIAQRANKVGNSPLVSEIDEREAQRILDRYGYAPGRARWESNPDNGGTEEAYRQVSFAIAVLGLE